MDEEDFDEADGGRGTPTPWVRDFGEGDRGMRAAEPPEEEHPAIKPAAELAEWFEVEADEEDVELDEDFFFMSSFILSRSRSPLRL